MAYLKSDQQRNWFLRLSVKFKSNLKILLRLLTAGISFMTNPKDQIVHVNKTTFLYCDASYDSKKVDLTYTWKFNGNKISTINDPFYRDVSNVLETFMYTECIAYCRCILHHMPFSVCLLCRNWSSNPYF